MPSPWLQVPLADYEGHMSAPQVDQLQALADLFEAALQRCQPASVAILGIAGGNGLDRIAKHACVARIVGLDIHPEYLDAVRTRFAELPGLELHCVDLAASALQLDPVEMVHCALVLEHAGTEQCLENAVAAVAPSGWMSLVLQRPSSSTHGVSPTGFASIQNLKDEFRLIDPEWLSEQLAARGFTLAQQLDRALVSGKAFWMGIFRKSASLASD